MSELCYVLGKWKKEGEGEGMNVEEKVDREKMSLIE